MNLPLEILKKGLLQQNRMRSAPRVLSPKHSPKHSPSIIHPNPKRFDYRVELLRERYFVSIHAMDKEDIIHEFIYIHPVTPPHSVKGASPSLPKGESFEPKTASDFKKNTLDTIDE